MTTPPTYTWLGGSGYLRGIRTVMGLELAAEPNLDPDEEEESPADFDADRRVHLAAALLLSVEPTDRALIGWGIPDQAGALRTVAMRPRRVVDNA
jgi:hypothetical protein